MARQDTKGKQEIRLTFDFINHDDPDSSNHNEVVYIDSPEIIGLVQAAAIMPGLILMAERLEKLTVAKTLRGGSEFADFLNSVSE